MSELLYRLQPTRPVMLTDGLTAAERDAVAAHVAYLERLVAAGVVLLFGRTQTTALDVRDRDPRRASSGLSPPT